MRWKISLEVVEELLVGLDHEQPGLDRLVLEQPVHRRKELAQQARVGKNRL